MSSAIVIGARGFLGSHLVTHLRARGQDVETLSYRPGCHEAFVDSFRMRVATSAPDLVIHAGASQSGRDDPSSLTELSLSNVVLPAAIAVILRDNAPECQLLTFGTSWQTSETGVAEPFNAYAASKSAAENFLAHFALDGVKLATLRLYDTYGPGDFRNKVVNLIADAIIHRSDLPMSSGRQVIELVHIRDVLAAIDLTLALLRDSRPSHHLVFSVRSGKPVTILEIVEMLTRLAGLDQADFIRPGVYPYRPRERFALFPDTPTPPGWMAQVSLEDGLRELLIERRDRAG